MNLLNFDLSCLANALERGEVTSVELTEECLRRMNMERHAAQFVSVDAEGAIAAARASDRRRAEGASLGLLDGIPFAAEDRFCVWGMETQNNCEMLRGYRPPYDAKAIQILRDAGAVLLGKVKTDGFLSGRTEKKNIREGLVGNDGAVPFALMAETSGSLIGQTARGAAACISPLVSRWGMISCAPSFDCVGVMAGTAWDCAALMQTLNHSNDVETTIAPKNCVCSKVALLGMTRDWFPFAGAECREAELPDLEILAQAYEILSAVESASEMAMYDGIRFGIKGEDRASVREQAAAIRGKLFSHEEQKLILLGTALLMDAHREGCYRAARGWREKLQRHLRDLLKDFDALICPLSEKTSAKIALLPSLAGLSAMVCEEFLWMTIPERETDLPALVSQISLERSVEK